MANNESKFISRQSWKIYVKSHKDNKVVTLKSLLNNARYLNWSIFTLTPGHQNKSKKKSVLNEFDNKFEPIFVEKFVGKTFFLGWAENFRRKPKSLIIFWLQCNGKSFENEILGFIYFLV